MPVSQADFAKEHGVSRKTVTAWKAAGRLVFDGDGIDVERSDALLRDAGLGRFKDVTPAVTPDARVTNEGDGQDESLLPDDETVAAFLNDLLSGRFRSQAEAERIKENALAGKHVLDLRTKAGILIEVEAAETLFFTTARAERDAWMNWPARTGPRLAAEFNLPADKVTDALQRYVHDELAQRGDPEFVSDD